jgi:hypothetical protein
MLTVMYANDMPTADELDRIAGSLAADGSLTPDDAERVVRVLRAVVAGLKVTGLSERVSDEGFD